jgi:hypothetical protein
MANIQIIQGDFKKKLKLPIAEGLKAEGRGLRAEG